MKRLTMLVCVAVVAMMTAGMVTAQDDDDLTRLNTALSNMEGLQSYRVDVTEQVDVALDAEFAFGAQTVAIGVVSRETLTMSSQVINTDPPNVVSVGTYSLTGSFDFLGFPSELNATYSFELRLVDDVLYMQVTDVEVTEDAEFTLPPAGWFIVDAERGLAFDGLDTIDPARWLELSVFSLAGAEFSSGPELTLLAGDITVTATTLDDGTSVDQIRVPVSPEDFNALLALAQAFGGDDLFDGVDLQATDSEMLNSLMQALSLQSDYFVDDSDIVRQIDTTVALDFTNLDFAQFIPDEELQDAGLLLNGHLETDGRAVYTDLDAPFEPAAAPDLP